MGTRSSCTRRIVGALLAIATASVSQPFVTRPAWAQQQSATTIVFAGSNVMAEQVMPTLLQTWGRNRKTPVVSTEGGADPRDYSMLLEGAEGTNRTAVQIRARGNTDGLEKLLRGEADVLMASRPPRDEDLKALQSWSFGPSIAAQQFRTKDDEFPVGRAALAIVVANANPMKTIGAKDIRDIYNGRFGTWGGPNNPRIARYALDPSHDSTELLCTAVLGVASGSCSSLLAKLAEPPKLTSRDIAEAVAADPNSIGYVEAGQRRSAATIGVAADCGNPIVPSAFNIKSGDYPWTTPLYFYTRPGQAKKPAVEDLLKFVAGPFGAATISASGVANLSPDISGAGYAKQRTAAASNVLDSNKTQAPAGDVKIFQLATDGYDRVSITFHFPAGSATPDAQAEADIGRVAALLQQPSFRTAEITLIGFASTANGEDKQLSTRRASAIRNALLLAGVSKTSAVAVGAAAPISCNLDAASQALNQRVEVWVRRG